MIYELVIDNNFNGKPFVYKNQKEYLEIAQRLYKFKNKDNPQTFPLGLMPHSANEAFKFNKNIFFKDIYYYTASEDPKKILDAADNMFKEYIITKNGILHRPLKFKHGHKDFLLSILKDFLLNEIKKQYFISIQFDWNDFFSYCKKKKFHYENLLPYLSQIKIKRSDNFLEIEYPKIHFDKIILFADNFEEHLKNYLTIDNIYSNLKEYEQLFSKTINPTI